MHRTGIAMMTYLFIVPDRSMVVSTRVRTRVLQYSVGIDTESIVGTRVSVRTCTRVLPT